MLFKRINTKTRNPPQLKRKINLLHFCIGTALLFIHQLANQLLNQSRVRIDINSEVDKLYVEALCKSAQNSSRVCIKGQHNNIVLVERDGIVVSGSRDSVKPMHPAAGLCPVPDHRLNLCSIYDFATSAPFDDIRFLLDGAEMNRKIAAEGLKGDYGLRIGKSIKNRVDQHILAEDLQNYCVLMTTAASDARMAGHTLPAMSNSGSGNQGITVMLPVVAVAEIFSLPADVTVGTRGAA